MESVFYSTEKHAFSEPEMRLGEHKLPRASEAIPDTDPCLLQRESSGQ
jgi:hypothetical protein